MIPIRCEYEVIKDKIYILNNLRFFIYEQNRKIRNLKFLHIEDTSECMEINDEFITKYDIINKYIELINSNYDCDHWPTDPYLKAIIRVFSYDSTNKNHIKESMQKMNTFCNYYEKEKRNKLIELLGKDANESNYINLLNNKLENYYEKLDNTYDMPVNYTIDYYKY